MWAGAQEDEEADTEGAETAGDERTEPIARRLKGANSLFTQEIARFKEFPCRRYLLTQFSVRM